jgi:hypothetical protein
VVRQVRAAFCFELIRLRGEPQPAGQFCGSCCEECPYYQRVHGMAARILIVTTDRALIDSVSCEQRPELELSFGSDAYSASAAVASFRPGFVVVDRDLPSGWRGLMDALADDSRLPGARLFLAAPPDARQISARGVRGVDGFLLKPFGLDALWEIVRAVAVEAYGPRPSEGAEGALEH